MKNCTTSKFFILLKFLISNAIIVQTFLDSIISNLSALLPFGVFIFFIFQR